MNYDDGFEDKDKSSHEERVYFGEEDKIEYKRKSTNVDYFKCVVKKIFRIRTSDPIFFLDGQDVYHDIFEFDQLSTSLLAESPESSKRITEN